MKDKNNLLTSMIVALLAGIVYYLAGADSIEKLAPQFGLIESKSQNKNDISVVFSRSDKIGGEKCPEIKLENPVHFKVKNVKKTNDGYEFKVNDEKELASSSSEPNMKFEVAMELLGNTEQEKMLSSKLEEVGKEESDLEWKTDQEPEVERPVIAWTESDFSHSLKSKVSTKTPKVYTKAMAAVYIGEGDIMTGKVKLHKVTNAGKDKTKTVTKQPVPDKKSTTPVIIDGNVIFIPDAKDQPEIKNDCDTQGVQGTKNNKKNKNVNVNVNVQTSNGVSFIYVTSDDDCNTNCKVKCNSK